ncbi:MFS transporter [Streptomyces sp. CA-111067]|uniref:MFS transporter n=1 Tax=Streptomyces sp. CA-111067 TaxID=3240046 RepID=UPI003D9874EE
MSKLSPPSLATGPAAASADRRADRRWWALPVILTGTFMTILDFFIVNVAIPSAQSDLHASDAQIQFVVAGYGTAYASGLITGGRLGDLYGRRRVFAIGLTAFTASSALCGLAVNADMLVASRVLQGLAAALMFPQVLSIINVTYTGADRPRAFSGFGVALGLASVSGQLIGGLLIAANIFGLGWRTCFLVNVPVGAAALALLPVLVAESRSDQARRLDLAGIAYVVPALLLLLVPLVEGRESGWPAWTWLSLAAAVAVLGLFLRQQALLSRRGGTPLVEPSLFRDRSFTSGLITLLAVYMGMASLMLILALFLQDGLHYSALQSGVAFLPMGVTFFAASKYAGRLTAAFGRRTLTYGAATVIAGEAGLAVTTAAIHGDGKVDLPLFSLFMAVTGAGIGAVAAPLISQILLGVDPQHAGSASGVLSTVQQVAGALGVAILGIIFYGSLGDTGTSSAYGHAFAAGLLWTISLAVVTVVVTARDRWWAAEPGQG